MLFLANFYNHWWWNDPNQCANQSTIIGKGHIRKLYSEQRTSIYSHQIAIIDDKKLLHFPDHDLPSLNLTDLLHPNIDRLTRPIQTKDLLVDSLYPIYNHQKISLQCLEPQFIELDGVKNFCDQGTLHSLIGNKTL